MSEATMPVKNAHQSKGVRDAEGNPVVVGKSIADFRPKPDSIPVKSIMMRNPLTLDLPGRSVPSLTADEYTKIEFIPGMRHHLVTIIPRGRHESEEVIRRFVPESWCCWVPL